MESSDSSRLLQMRAAIARSREPFEFKPFLSTIWTKTKDHAHWVALGLLVGVGIFSYWNTSTLIKVNGSQRQLRMLLNEVQEVRCTVLDAETGQRGYLLVGEKSYLAPYQSAVLVADEQLDREAADERHSWPRVPNRYPTRARRVETHGAEEHD